MTGHRIECSADLTAAQAPRFHCDQRDAEHEYLYLDEAPVEIEAEGLREEP